MALAMVRHRARHMRAWRARWAVMAPAMVGDRARDGASWGPPSLAIAGAISGHRGDQAPFSPSIRLDTYTVAPIFRPIGVLAGLRLVRRRRAAWCHAAAPHDDPDRQERTGTHHGNQHT